MCYFGPQMTTDVVFVDTSHLKCKVGGLAAIGQFVCLFIQFCRGQQEEPAIILVTRAFDCMHGTYVASFVWTSTKNE